MGRETWDVGRGNPAHSYRNVAGKNAERLKS